LNSILILRVAARFQREADQPLGARKETRYLVTPVNKPKGISKETVKNYIKTEDEMPESMKADKRDLIPKDLFQPTPNNVNMINYVNKGWPGDSSTYQDMEQALNKQVPKDKGYKTVSNLSQYLLQTEGGGGTDPVRK